VKAELWFIVYPQRMAAFPGSVQDMSTQQIFATIAEFKNHLEQFPQSRYRNRTIAMIQILTQEWQQRIEASERPSKARRRAR
jgi:outer membrane protein assembly factor BamD (BamD/ComL family)